MNRRDPDAPIGRGCVPRVSGDEPDLIELLTTLGVCSPRERG